MVGATIVTRGLLSCKTPYSEKRLQFHRLSFTHLLVLAA